MLFYKDEEDFKRHLEHDIEWSDEQIKMCNEFNKRNRELIKSYKERLKGVSDADTIKSIKSIIETARSSFIKTEGVIRGHMERSVKWRQIFEQSYGYRYGEKPKKRPARKKGLTLIQGGLTDTKIHGGILSEIGKKFFAELVFEREG